MSYATFSETDADDRSLFLKVNSRFVQIALLDFTLCPNFLSPIQNLLSCSNTDPIHYSKSKG